MNRSPRIPERTLSVMAADGNGMVDVLTRETPVPGRGEVLIRMAAAPVNPSDLGLINNAANSSRAYPLPAGREGSGTVVAAGAGPIGRFLLGRRVACASREGGTWAEYAAVKAANCIPLRRDLSFEQGSMLLVNPLTAYAFFELIRKQKHRAVVNTAAGGALGRMILRMGRRRDIPVIHIARREAQAEALTAMGAVHVLLSSDPEFHARLRDLSHTLGATLFLDAVAGEMTGRLLSAAPRGSTILVYGNLSGEEARFDPYLLINEDKHVRGFFLANWSRRAGFLKLLWIMAQVQRLIPGALATKIGRRFALNEASEAAQYAAHSASSGKAVFVIEPHDVSAGAEGSTK